MSPSESKCSKNTVCNWRIDYQNRNGSTVYRTYRGATHATCNFGAMYDIGPSNVTVRKGKQCARLFVGGSFRGEQCHNIH